jgi:hypothetical protein
LLDRLAEGKVFKCVQRIVMYEDLDGRLRGQQVSQVFDGVPQTFESRRYVAGLHELILVLPTWADTLP